MNNSELHFFTTKKSVNKEFFIFYFQKRDYENNPAY